MAYSFQFFPPFSALSLPGSGARLKWLAGTVGAAVLLSACGGGGSGGGDGRIDLAAGDSFSYQSVSSVLGVAGSTSSVYTTTVKSSTGLGSTQVVTYQNGAAARTQVYTEDDRLSSDSYGSVSCSRSPTGQVFPGGIPALDQTWTYGYSELCTQSGVTLVSSTATGSGRIVGFESKLVAGVAVDAVKYLVGEQVLRTDGIAIARQQTCWRDRAMMRVLACSEDATQTSTAPGTSPSLSHTDLTLLGFSVAANALQLPTRARFAGVWDGDFTGADVGICTLSIDLLGAAAGTCYSDVNGAFTLSGTVALDGSFTASASNGGSLSGSLTSPLAGAGRWTRTGTTGGGWSLNHR